MSVQKIANTEELETFAAQILSMLPQKKTANVLALSGELGAGKTTFTQALARQLGVTEHITSPTFVVMKSYAIPGHEQVREMFHIDAYRIEDVEEMRVLKLPELFEREGALVCIEWPERIASLIPEDALRIHFSIGADETREVTYGN